MWMVMSMFILLTKNSAQASRNPLLTSLSGTDKITDPSS